MDEQRLKERIRAYQLKISDMEQEVLILRAKIEREKQILQRWQGSFESKRRAEINERF
jgi:hypothetical protein